MPVDAQPHPAPTPLRASDAEREETVARLHHALGEGRLDLAETEVRVAAAYAATHRDDLPPLLADLPGAPDAAAPGPTWSAVWTSVVWWARSLLLGPAAGAGQPPGSRQRRLAAAVTVIAVVWMLVWAFLGAALVAS